MCKPVPVGSHVKEVKYSNEKLGNGQYYGTATLKCDDEYVMRGSAKVSCNQPGRWSPSIPICESKI